MKWYEQYPYDHGKVNIYQKFKTVEEYEQHIPINLKLSILKATVRETVHWVEFHQMYGCWPTTKQINIARGSRLGQPQYYTIKDLIVENNFGEHY